MVSRLWSEAYASVLAANDLELFSLPRGIGMITLVMASQPHIKETRRENLIRGAELDAASQGTSTFFRTTDDIRLQGPGRRLTEQGRGLGQDR